MFLKYIIQFLAWHVRLSDYYAQPQTDQQQLSASSVLQSKAETGSGSEKENSTKEDLASDDRKEALTATPKKLKRPSTDDGEPEVAAATTPKKPKPSTKSATTATDGRAKEKAPSASSTPSKKSKHGHRDKDRDQERHRKHHHREDDKKYSRDKERDRDRDRERRREDKHSSSSSKGNSASSSKYKTDKGEKLDFKLAPTPEKRPPSEAPIVRDNSIESIKSILSGGGSKKPEKEPARGESQSLPSTPSHKLERPSDERKNAYKLFPKAVNKVLASSTAASPTPKKQKMEAAAAAAMEARSADGTEHNLLGSIMSNMSSMTSALGGGGGKA